MLRRVAQYFLVVSALHVANAPLAVAQLRPDNWQFWTMGAAALVAAAATDNQLRAALRAPQSALERNTAHAVEPLGREAVDLSALGATFAVAHLLGATNVAQASGRIAAGYLATDFVTGVLKPLVGRARPFTDLGPHTYKRFAGDHEFHSFPSGHSSHAFALAAGISAEARRPWVTGVSYGTAALVGWSRVHDDAHWASDVVAGAIIGTSASLTTVKWLQRKRKMQLGVREPITHGIAVDGVSISPSAFQIRVSF